MATPETYDLDNPPAGFDLAVGDRIVYRTERIAPLGSILYDREQQLDQVRDQMLDQAAARGLELVSVSSGLRDTGTFRYTAEIVFQVYGVPDHPQAPDQLAGIEAWQAVVGLAALALVGWIVTEASLAIRDAPETIRDLAAAFQTAAVAAALLGFVYLLSKGNP